jgi:CheY-like chemotaxis protein
MRTGAPILLVEDDKVDQLSVKRAMKEAGITNPLLIASHGEAALEMLRSDEKPSLILLDLNMPRMNGLELLRHIKSEDSTRAIPVIVITTSNSAEERIEAFRLGVCGFMIKPVEFPDFADMFVTIKKYWTLSLTPY